MRLGIPCQRCIRNSKQTTSRVNLQISKRRWTSTITTPRSASARQNRSGVYDLRNNNPALSSASQDLRNSLAQKIRRQSSHASASVPTSVRLQPDNLFHIFSESPIPEIRQRAFFMKTHAYCPHPDHHRTRVPASPDDLEARKAMQGDSKTGVPPAHVRFECPDCGLPVYCSEDHWVDDYETHIDLCDTLRQANEDDHDLRSGRVFPEFEFPQPQAEEFLVNMMNWDTYLYTRQYEALNEPKSMRHATRMLTYPITLGSVLHELSPYNIRKGGRLTMEGLKSLSGKLASRLRRASIDGGGQLSDTPYILRKMAETTP